MAFSLSRPSSSLIWNSCCCRWSKSRCSWLTNCSRSVCATSCTSRNWSACRCSNCLLKSSLIIHLSKYVCRDKATTPPNAVTQRQQQRQQQHKDRRGGIQHFQDRCNFFAIDDLESLESYFERFSKIGIRVGFFRGFLKEGGSRRWFWKLDFWVNQNSNGIGLNEIITVESFLVNLIWLFDFIFLVFRYQHKFNNTSFD